MENTSNICLDCLKEPLTVSETLSMLDNIFQQDSNWTGDDCQESPLEGFAEQVIRLHSSSNGKGLEAKTFALKCHTFDFKNIANFYWHLFPNTQTPMGSTVTLLFIEGTKKYMGGTTYICDKKALFLENKSIAKGAVTHFFVKKAIIYACVSPENTEFSVPTKELTNTDNAKYYCLAENGSMPYYAHEGDSTYEALLGAIKEACRLSMMLKQKVYVLRFLD